MNRKRHQSNTATALLALAMTSPIAAHAEEAGGSMGWQHRLTVYGWFPSIEGTINYDLPGSGDSASSDASDYLDKLKMAFMGAYEGRRDEWSLKVDLIYLNFGNTDQNAISIPIGPGQPQIQVAAKQDLIGWQLGLYGGYSAVQTEDVTLDVMAGLRYLDIDLDARLDISGPLPPTIPSRELSESVGLWDGVVGVKGHFDLNKNWYIPYHLDVGTGDSDLTWQALGGVGYRFDWGGVLLGYRYLYYDQGDSGVIQDLEFSGPVFGVNFDF